MADGGGDTPTEGQLGPPDLIPHIIPVDLVNSVSRPRAETLEYSHNGNNARQQQQHPPADIVEQLGNQPADLVDQLQNVAVLQAVDIVDSLPANIPPGSPASDKDINGENGMEASGNGDDTDARWWSRGTGSASGGLGGIPMPTHKDSENYNMKHRRRGKAFIFNHMNFESKLQLRARNGTDNDRDNLRVVLRQLDFQVEVYNDLPCKEVERILETASLEDHSEADCIFVAVLSHGELGILYASDHPYKPENLWTHFTADKCPTLAGKPKMFFIQACQGDRLDGGVKMVARTQHDAGSTTYKIPTHADFLIGYSTIPGFYSWRNTTQGSWFVQALCHMLQTEGRNRDLLSILTRVCRKVAFDFQSNVPGDFRMHENKQIPCITSMLTRDIFFDRA